MSTKNIAAKDAILAITLLFLLLQWRFNWPYGMLAIAGFILVTILSTQFVLVCYKAWMGLAKILNAISSFVLLLFVYLFIVLPTALYVKAFKKSSIRFSSLNSSSNFITVEKIYNKKDFINPW